MAAAKCCGKAIDRHFSKAEARSTAAETLLLRSRNSVPEFINNGPLLRQVLATQISTAQTRRTLYWRASQAG